MDIYIYIKRVSKVKPLSDSVNSVKEGLNMKFQTWTFHFLFIDAAALVILDSKHHDLPVTDRPKRERRDGCVYL